MTPGAQFMHLFVDPKKGVTREQIEEELNLAIDWYRYYAKCYVLYTTSDQNQWYNRLESLVRPDGSLFIAPLDVTRRHGWMSKDFWEWIDKAKDK